MRIMLKSKIHKATVTDTNLKYVGSITIDEDLMEKSDLLEGEQVLVANSTNGARFYSYAIKGKKNSGIICINGAATHLVNKGDEIIIMAFGLTDRKIKSRTILVDNKNKFVRYL